MLTNDPVQDRFIRNQVLRNRPQPVKQIVGNLHQVTNVRVTGQTIRNLLHSGHLRVRFVFTVTTRHIAYRCEWCSERQNWRITMRLFDRFGGGSVMMGGGITITSISTTSIECHGQQ